MFEYLRDPKHVLFTFGEEINEPIDSLSLLEPWKNEMQIYRIVKAPLREPSAHVRYICDTNQIIMGRYGVRSNSLVLVRPDGYIGYQSDSQDFRKLLHYLEETFSA